MKALRIIGLTFALVFSTVAISNILSEGATPPGDWEKLGMKQVNLKADHNELLVTFHEGY